MTHLEQSEKDADRLTEADRVTRRSGFSTGSERYDRVRPTYPAALFDAVTAYGGLVSGSRVLEIGPGTGQATRSMVDRGWRVTAVEVDPAMAAQARIRLGDRARIVVGAFEEQPPPDEPVDLVFCATSFHWLDPAVRLDRIAAALRPGGTAAVLWSRHVKGGDQPFFDAAQSCYARFGDDDPAMGLLDEDAVRPRTAEFEQSDRFGAVTSRRFAVEIGYDTADYLDLLRTYSETIALPTDDRTALLDCIGATLDDGFGGRVRKRYLFDLVLARRAV